MDLTTLFNLSLATQVALAAGYLSYVISYAGWREHHTSIDVMFISLAYAAIASLALLTLSEFGPWVAAPGGFLAALIAAALWRSTLRNLSHGLLRKMKVHSDDGLGTAWQALVQRKGLTVGQVSVHTADGRILYQSNGCEYVNQPFDGLYLGSDGSILMAVQKERMKDGTIEERRDILDPDWGLRLTYLPAASISRVNIRVAK